MLKQKGILSKNYLLLWSGQLVSQMGNRLYLMALSWYFVSELGDNTALFLVFIFSSLPSLLFGAFVGPFIERWNKKHIMIGCDFICAALVGVLAWLVSINEAHNYIIYAVCFLLNTMNLFFSPSVNSTNSGFSEFCPLGWQAIITNADSTANNTIGFFFLINMLLVKR